MAVRVALVFALAFLTLPANAQKVDIEYNSPYGLMEGFDVYAASSDTNFSVSSPVGMQKMGIVGTIPIGALYQGLSLYSENVLPTAFSGSGFDWSNDFKDTAGLVEARIYKDVSTILGGSPVFHFQAAAFKLSYNSSDLDDKKLRMIFTSKDGELPLLRRVNPVGNSISMINSATSKEVHLVFDFICRKYDASGASGVAEDKGDCDSVEYSGVTNNKFDTIAFNTGPSSDRNFAVILQPKYVYSDSTPVAGAYETDLKLVILSDF